MLFGFLLTHNTNFTCYNLVVMAAAIHLANHIYSVNPRIDAVAVFYHHGMIPTVLTEFFHFVYDVENSDGVPSSRYWEVSF